MTLTSPPSRKTVIPYCVADGSGFRGDTARHYLIWPKIISLFGRILLPDLAEIYFRIRLPNGRTDARILSLGARQHSEWEDVGDFRRLTFVTQA